jgi:hypothetical protein
MEQSSLPNGVPQPPQGERTIVAPINAPQAAVGEQGRVAAPEQGVGGGERMGQPQGGPGQPVFISPTPPPQVQPVAQSTAQAAPADINPVQADDVDVIEKEWIDRAKQIVNATKDDPRAQERKVSELQSDYLKKRYGKDIGLSEE